MASYAHISALTAVTVLAKGSVQLKKVVINTKGATSNLLTLYDNASAASGTVIAVIDTTSAVGDIDYGNLNTLNGLTAVLAAGTAADLTIVWD